MKDVLEQEQEDFYGRLLADSFFADVALLFQRKGVTENDIQNALSVLNDRGTGKLGAVVIVLMPSLTPEDPGVPTPKYLVRQTVQVIELPLINQGASGTGITAERLAQRVRQVFHQFSSGQGGCYVFDSMEPVNAIEGQISYGVAFTRKAGDPFILRVATPKISATATAAPATITVTCATADAAIWYTTDGSYPASTNPAALKYLAPFVQATGATIRAASEKAAMQQSNVAQITVGAAADTVPSLAGEGGEALQGEGGETLKAEG